MENKSHLGHSWVRKRKALWDLMLNVNVPIVCYCVHAIVFKLIQMTGTNNHYVIDLSIIGNFII